MKILLDTHAAIWWIGKHHRLSNSAKMALLDYSNEIFVSVASIWEFAIKSSLGKIHGFNGGSRAFLSELQDFPIIILAVEPKHVHLIENLPPIHKDPFDRLLISTAIMEDMSIITSDVNIHKYSVNYIW